MSNFTGVSWQPDDEVTSAKLQQMCTNDDWLKENLILGDAYFVGNVQHGNQTPAPFTIGTKKINRIDTKVKPFHSLVPVTALEMDINIPPGYTNVPTCVLSITDPYKQGQYITLLSYNGLTSIKVRMAQADNIAKIIVGQVHCIFVGY